MCAWVGYCILNETGHDVVGFPCGVCWVSVGCRAYLISR